MTTRQKIGATMIVIFFFIALGFAGKADLEFEMWEAQDTQRILEEAERRAEREVIHTGNTFNPLTERVVPKQWGIASFYDYKLEPEVDENGLFTGEEIGVPCNRNLEECYTEDKLFAASREYRRGSILKVSNKADTAFIYVVVTDYIEHPEELIDLTSFAFKQLAPLEVGLIDVNIEFIAHKDDIEPTTYDDLLDNRNGR